MIILDTYNITCRYIIIGMSNNIGILDVDGVNKNPLTNEDYSDNYKRLAKVWSTFPAYKRADEILEVLGNSQVTIVTSGTGSGKTVLLPKLLLHHFNYDKKIAVTLPKQIIVKSTAEFAAETLDVRLGSHVGYQYKGSDKKYMSKNNKLVYITDGSLVVKIMNDMSLSDMHGVVIDEAHERNIRIDFLLYLIKEVLKRRPEFKLVIMSATINTNLFKKYYNEFTSRVVDISGVPLYPIKSIYLTHSISVKDYFKKGIEILQNILKTTTGGDILFFVTSINETMDACKIIRSNPKAICLEVFSGIRPDRQALVEHVSKYKEGTKYERKVVIATNAAESSLTIDGIKYVIDCGYELSGTYDAKLNANKLDRQKITQAQARQRMGRSGRTGPGVCYHLYTETDFQMMDQFPQPEIRVSDISSECLRLLNTDYIKDVKMLIDVFTKFIEPPKKEYILSALRKLRSLKLITDDNITELGKIVNSLRVPIPELGVAIVYGYMYGVVFDVLRIVSILDTTRFNISDLFSTPFDKLNDDTDKKAKAKLMDKFDDAKSKFTSGCGDLISLYKIYTKYNKLNDKDVDQFIFDNWLKQNKLINIRKNNMRSKGAVMKNVMKNKYLDDKIKEFNNITKDLSDNDRILLAFYMGFRNNVGVYNSGIEKYKVGDEMYGVARDSFVNYLKKNPKKIFFMELFITMGSGSLNIVSVLPDKIHEKSKLEL